jgi:iron(III) transport system ATP-binding protein
MTSLEINDLSVDLNSRRVLRDLNLQIPSGSFAAILGPSGCGKTTLLRSIAGLITPSSGAIRFGKQLVSVSSLVLPPHKRNIGYVPQEGGLFPHLSVAENVSFSLSRKMSSKDKNQIINEMLELVGMKDFNNRSPQELSGGQQTRIALARALAMKPAMVLLDEPFAALDQALRVDISQEVVALLKKSGTTSIMVTHDREDALVSADVIALMRGGTVVQSGTPAQVYLNPISAEVALSTGDIDVIPAIKLANSRYATALNQVNFNLNNQSPANLGKILIRPEEIAISEQVTDGSVTATIAKINYYGHDALFELKVGQSLQSVRARITGPSNFRVGDTVSISHRGPIRWISSGAQEINS